jgi:phosphopantothenoylcysteine decarboxylase/phosphopantothenate--cysteine ligase
MHTEMWLNAATQNNVSILRSRGVVVIDPAVGRLTGSDSGPGRLPEVEQIAQIALAQVSQRSKDLADKHVLITAGGTREYLDPVRFLGNSSSGKQGIALAQAARERGAEVTLICANVTLPLPHGVDVVQVETGSQLAAAVLARSEHADVVVMAAAVADFAPVQVLDTKMKKVAGQEEVTLTLRPTVDILAKLSADKKPGQVIVGFAAETGDSNGSVLEHAQKKLATKGCDLLVVNQVGSGLGFGTDDNEVTILIREPQSAIAVARAPKLVIAHAVLDAVIA